MMAREWTCNCGWSKELNKDVWYEDPDCKGRHHPISIPAQHDPLREPKHEKKAKHRK